MSRLYLDYVVDDDKVKKLSFRFGPELRAYLNEAKDRIGAQDEPFVRWATKVLLEFAESVNPHPYQGPPIKEGGNAAKITEADARRVWQLHAEGWSNISISREIGISPQNVSSILNGIIWKNSGF